VHSREMLMLGRNGLGRDREAQLVRVPINGTLTQARPTINTPLMWEGLLLGHSPIRGAPQLFIAKIDSLERQVNGLRVPICTALSGYSSFE
jgi:hypothetical protein